MIVRPAGFSSSEDESDIESGYSDSSSVDGSSSPLESLQNAIEKGSAEDVESIIPAINFDEYVKLPNGFSPLTYAAFSGKTEVLQFFINYSKENIASNESRLSSKYEAFMSVCSVDAKNFDEGHRECFELLINEGLDVDEKDRYGVNALMMACKSGSAKIVEILLARDASVNAVDNNGWSPLFYAANRGDIDVIAALLERGADKNKTDKRDRYAYTIASHKGFSQIANSLKPDAVAKLEKEDAESDIRPSSGKKVIDLSEYDDRFCQEASDLVLASGNDMRRYLRSVQNNRVTLRRLLMSKTEDHLRSIGILFSFHRKSLLKRIRQFHLGCWSPGSFALSENLEDFEHYSFLFLLLTFAATVNRQLHIIRATLEYVEGDILSSNLSSSDLIEILTNIKTRLIFIGKRLNGMRRYILVAQNNSPRFLHAQDVNALK